MPTRTARQDLSGARDDGTLVGKGGRTQRLGAAASRRLAATKPNPNTVSTKPVVRPEKPAWQQLRDQGIEGQGSRGANMAALRGFRTSSLTPIRSDGLQGTEEGPPVGIPGFVGAQDIMQRISQLAQERGMEAPGASLGGGPAIAPAPPPVEVGPVTDTPVARALRGFRPIAAPMPMDNDMLDGGGPGGPGLATLPALGAPTAPGPPPPAGPAGMTKPMPTARPMAPKPPWEEIAGAIAPGGPAGATRPPRPARNAMAGLSA